MEGKQILLNILICYGLFMLCFWMFYTQQFSFIQSITRSKVSNGSASTQKFILRHYSSVKDSFMFEGGGYVSTDTVKPTKSFVNVSDNHIVPPSVPMISVRNNYLSLSSVKTLQYDCDECALVSSSGQLIGSGLGSEIDKKQCVIRMNNAPSLGFQNDVGKRTTVRVGSFNAVKSYRKTANLFKGDARPDLVLIWGLYQKKHVKILNEAKQLHRLYPNTQFFAETLKGEEYAGNVFEKETGMDRVKTKTWLSTGWFTMLIAIDLCKKVTLYGFIPEDHCKTHPKETKKYHYYQNPNSSLTECKYYSSNEARKGSGHRFVTEKAIFARWALHYNMTFYSPTWNLTKYTANMKMDTPFVNIQTKAQTSAKNIKTIIRRKIIAMKHHL